jgi:hypothetical protein
MCASGSPAAASSSMRASTSSPVTVAILARQPLARKAATSASRAAAGFNPPALRMNFTPRARGHSALIIGTRSRV